MQGEGSEDIKVDSNVLEKATVLPHIRINGAEENKALFWTQAVFQQSFPLLWCSYLCLRETGLLSLWIRDHLPPLHLFSKSLHKLGSSTQLFLPKTVPRGRTEGRVRI